jgi:hypothetical protein
MASEWADAQNDAIVADDFAMLADDIAGRPYSEVGWASAHHRKPAGPRYRRADACAMRHRHWRFAVVG